MGFNYILIVLFFKVFFFISIFITFFNISNHLSLIFFSSIPKFQTFLKTSYFYLIFKLNFLVSLFVYFFQFLNLLHSSLQDFFSFNCPYFNSPIPNFHVKLILFYIFCF